MRLFIIVRTLFWMSIFLMPLKAADDKNQNEAVAYSKKALSLKTTSNEFQILIGKIVQNEKLGLKYKIVHQVLSSCPDEVTFSNCLRILFALIAHDDEVHGTQTILPPGVVMDSGYSKKADRDAGYKKWENRVSVHDKQT